MWRIPLILDLENQILRNLEKVDKVSQEANGIKHIYFGHFDSDSYFCFIIISSKKTQNTHFSSWHSFHSVLS